MFGMLKRGFRPTAKSASKPAASAEPAPKVKPKGERARYRVFESGHLKSDSKRKKRLVGTDKVFVVDEEGDVFRQNPDGSYVRKRIDMELPAVRDERTGRVTKTTTYDSPENALAAIVRGDGGTLRRETGDHGNYAPKHGTWAGKEHDQKIQYRSKEELASLGRRVKLRKTRLELDKQREWQTPYSESFAHQSKERMTARQPGRRAALFVGPTTPSGWTPPADSASSPRQKVRAARSNVFSRHANTANPNIGPVRPPQEPEIPPELVGPPQELVGPVKPKTARRPTKKKTETSTATGTGAAAAAGGRPPGYRRLINQDAIKAAENDGVGVRVGGDYFVPKDQSKTYNSRGYKTESGVQSEAAAEQAAEVNVEPTPKPEAKATGRRKKRVGQTGMESLANIFSRPRTGKP